MGDGTGSKGGGRRGCRRVLLILIGGVLLACVCLVAFSYMASELGLVPDSTEIAQTEAVESASTGVAMALAATETTYTPSPEPSATALPSTTPIPTSTLMPTYTSEPSLTPTITNTPEPIILDNSMAASLFDAAVRMQGYESDSRYENGNFMVDIQDVAGADTLETRMSIAGAAVGALTSTLAQEDGVIVEADRPNQVVINYKSGNIVLVRVRFSYTLAEQFANGQVTANQFVNSWTVE